MRRTPREPKPLADLMVSYSAGEMPVPVIEHLQVQTLDDFERGETDASKALKIVNLLLTIALMKLAEPETAR
jgi:hypothetical protein